MIDNIRPGKIEICSDPIDEKLEELADLVKVY